MENKFSKFINLQGKYLTSLLFVLFFAVGQMWGETTTKTYSFDDNVALSTDWDVATQVPTNGTAICEITNSLSGAGFSAQDGKYLGLAYKDKSNIGINITSKASYNSISEVSLKVVAGDNSKPTFAVYIVTSSGDEEILAAVGSKNGFSTGGTNKWGSKTITVSPAKTGKIKIVTIASSSGKYAAIDDISVEYTPAASTNYTITYNNNGGSGSMDNSTNTVAECTFTAPSATQEFKEWNTKADGTGDSYAAGDAATKALDLYAIWQNKVIKYTVKYYDGATKLGEEEVEANAHPANYATYQTKALASFVGWYSDPELNTPATPASATITAATSFYGKWNKTYAQTIDLAAEAAGDKTAIATFLAGKGYAANVGGSGAYDTNASGYLGYKFKNNGDEIQFNLQNGKIADLYFMYIETNFKVYVDGVETYTVTNKTTSSTPLVRYIYANGADKFIRIVNNSANSKTSVINKIAIHNPYVVTYNANGGDDVAAATYYGTALTLPSATKGTDSFLGWFDAAEGGNKIGEAGESYTPSASIELFAHWEAVSTDARLASITFSAAGTLAPAFDPEVTNYTYTMPYGTAAVPTITGATSVNANAQAPVIEAQAANWNETAIIRGKAQSGDTKAYNITMKLAPKDGVSIIKVATTGGSNKTVTGAYAGDGDVNLSSSKKMDGGKYIGFSLDGTTLQAGDRINVHTTQASSSGGSHIIFYDNMTDKNELYETGEIGGVGDNIFVINAAMVGATTAYVYRSDADNAHKWNGYVDYIEVLRAMNPMLTAITIDGRAGVIDEANKTVAVTIPYEADLAALTIVDEVIWNAAAASDAKVVTSNSGNWVIGENTYRITDKDGDYTDYTITLDRDVLKHTVSFNVHGGSAVASEEVEHNAYLAAAPADPTKEDYIFQGWAETEDGAIVDVTTFAITADKEFHAVWVSDGAIKLIVSGALNTTDFYTGATMADSPVEIESVNYDYAILSNTASSPSGVNQLNKLIAYNAKTTKTKVLVDVYNSSTSGRNVYIKGVVEGSDEVVDLANIVLDNADKKHVKSQYYEFNNAANRTIYISVPSSANTVYFLQVKVIESGSPLKAFGEAGYSFNFNKGRLFGPSSANLEFEGMNIRLSSNYAAVNSTVAKIKSTNVHFDVAAPVTMTVTTNNAATYYVATSADGTTNETAKTGASEFDLTAGTWYINAGGSEVQLTNIAFAAPKCAEPVIDNDPESNTNFGPGNLTASVTAHATDGATLAYQWYDADDNEVAGATDATLTTTTPGTYYVIITASKDGYENRSVQSANATLGYRDITIATLSALSYGGTAIALEADKYEYRVDLPEGTTDVPALAATATQAAYDATAVPTNAAAFENYEAISTVLVTAEDGVTTQTYTVHFYVDHIYTELVPVTGSTTWNWTGGDDVTINDVANKGLILANYIDGLEFEKIEGKENERARRNQNGGCYQGTQLHFNTTVYGKVKIYFRAPSSGDNCTIYVNNNGKRMNVGNRGNSFGWSKEVVVKGDVVIEMVKDGGGDTRVQQIVFTEVTPDYTRNVSNNIGTLCVDHNVLAGGFVGATFYQIAGRNQEYSYKIDFEEVGADEELVAGEPYIFQSTTGKIELYYGKTVATQPVDVKGMHGTFSAFNLSITEENKLDVMYISNNKLWNCGDLVGTGLNVVENRAYIVMSEVPEQTSSSAPGRRRITLVTNAEQVATGVDTLNASETPVKVMINGQIFIIRGEKMFGIDGKLIK